MWLDTSMKKLTADRNYSRSEILSFLHESNPELSDNSMDWLIYRLISEKKLFRTSRDSYSLTDPELLPEYKPLYSDQALALISYLENRFPELNYVVFENTLLNEFLNHQIAKNTIYLQVEKEVSSVVYETLRNEYTKNILLTPGKKEMEFYWEEGCVVIINLISQAPINLKNPHHITLEKMLIDIMADKTISSSFSPAELPDIYKIAGSIYRLDKNKLIRYAGRRGKKEEAEKYLEEI